MTPNSFSSSVNTLSADASGRWGLSWLGWSDYRPFWEQTLRWVMRPPTPQNVVLRTRQEGDKGIVELEALSESTGFLNFLRTDARVLRPDNTIVDLPLQQIGPGRYRAEFPVDREGAYLVNVAFGAADGQTKGTVQGAVAVPYAREFRSVRDNLALLRAVAERTGGRVLSEDPLGVTGFFDRKGLEMPRSPKRIWDLLTIVAAALFVLDVASRRIAIDPETIARWSRMLFRPSEATSDATVAAWKRAREEAAKQRERGGAGAAAADPSVASRRFDAEQSEAESIDVAQESSGQAPPRPTPASSAPPSSSEPPVADDDVSATARLLKAKRRAQQPRSEDEKEKPSG